MNQTLKFVLSALALAALGACGGGGGGGDSGSTKYTAADVQNTATLGVLTTERVGMTANDIVEVLGSVLESLASLDGGSQTVTVSLCSSGSTTANVVKSAVGPGLHAGDQVTLTFSSCAVNGTSYSLNGSAAMTVQSGASSYSPTDYSIAFQAQLTNVVASATFSTVTHNGAIDAQTSVVASNAWTNSFTVTAGKSFVLAATGFAGGAFQLTLDGGAAFTATDVASPSSSSRKLDGSVTDSIAAGAVPMIISTPSALVGSKSSGSFVAASGVINTMAVSENMATTTTFNGATATITGDSDGNGSQDMTVNVSSSALSVH